jgi:hypothetical protein
MSDSFSPSEWNALGGQLATEAAAKLGAAVVLIAIGPEGIMNAAVCAREAYPAREAMEDLPSFLERIAAVMRQQDDVKRENRH